LDQVHLIAMTRSLVELAADIAARSQLRSLDSIHLATAVTAECTHFLTFDLKQANVAETFGLVLLAKDLIELA
jgi:predicted nucleic acid-binding protein